MIRTFKKSISNSGIVLVASVLLFGSSQQASAQDLDIGAALGQALSEAFNKAAEAAAKRRVSVTSLNTITDSTKEITLEFEHKGSEKLTAKLTIADNPNGGVGDKKASESADSGKKKTSLFDEEKNKQDTSSVTYKPMSSWIIGLPDSITVAPGEKKKITVRVKIPADAVAGEYAAWIATQVTPDKNSPVQIPVVAVTKLAYKK